jgi:hypothetical protein
VNPEELLRRAFEARASQVEVAPDALGTIRRRIAGRGRRRALTIGLTSLATTAAAVAATVAIAFGLPRDTAMPPGDPSGGTPTSSTAPPPATTGPSPTTGPAAPVGVRVPVYFAGAATPPRLYREFHATTVPVDTLEARIAAAVGRMLRGLPIDPDYQSLWPSSATVRGVRLQGSVAVVDVAGAADHIAVAAVARAAAQQLVWTVTAVTADQEVQLSGVRLLLDGRAANDLWGHVDLSRDLTRASGLDTLGRVWLISPQQNDTVNREFTVHIDGTVPEANVILRVTDAGGATVSQEPVMLDAGGPARGQARVSLTLEPGRYTLSAYFESLEDGSVQALDDHEITVR